MIDWTTIDTVLLDMDGTLLDLHFDTYFWLQHLPRLYASKHQITAEEAVEVLHGESSSVQGTLEWYCLDHWTARLDMDLASMKREVQHMISARPFAIEFLQRLHASSRDVVMVTNAHRTTLDIKMENVDLTGWFDRVVVSHELNAAKEEQRFWHALQELHPFDPARTLLIDDTERVLDSAAEYGIAHLLTLLQPDSQQQKRLDTRFPGIHHFDEIMPQEIRA
ncbi:MAG: HAD superfamily hydrolase (TIGR01509 family) [Halioglobus sp.]|jgi:HAD superfamily hydrolase (TIGR01509 family)